MDKTIKENPPLCACGCNQPVKRGVNYPHIWNKYINGHNVRDRVFETKPQQLCECECGNLTMPGNRCMYGHNVYKDAIYKHKDWL